MGRGARNGMSVRLHHPDSRDNRTKVQACPELQMSLPGSITRAVSQECHPEPPPTDAKSCQRAGPPGRLRTGTPGQCQDPPMPTDPLSHEP